MQPIDVPYPLQDAASIDGISYKITISIILNLRIKQIQDSPLYPQ